LSRKVTDFAKWLFRRAGLEVRNRRTVYVDPVEDLVGILGDVSAPTIFDIGANRGDTIAEYRAAFKQATIHAFEPTPELAVSLDSRFRNDSKIRIVNKAIGDREGIATFHRMSDDLLNSLLPYQVSDSRYHGVVQERSIEVAVTSIDNYCRDNRIDSVHLVKLDIQGAEKLALAGARSMLGSGRIECVYLEICFLPVYENQTLFGDIEDHLTRVGYRLFGIYEMYRERNGCLDFCNALFVSRDRHSKLNPRWVY
jgi:FkbM family methyltransferase